MDLAVYDLTGRRVKTLAQGLYDTGDYCTRWTGNDAQGRALASGTYFIRLHTGRDIKSRKITLVQ